MTKFLLLEKAKNEGWKIYDKWRKEDVFCPAFNRQVIFSLQGWRHIIGATGHKKRTSDDTYRRLKLLPHAKEIIEKSATIQNIIEKRGKKYFVLEAITLVTENNKKDYRKIRVIIVEDRRENKIFLSVMDKKRTKKSRLPHTSVFGRQRNEE